MAWKWIIIPATVFLFTAFLLVTFVLFQRTGLSDTELQASLEPSFEADSRLGEVLYHMGGCANCHVSEDGESLPSGGKQLHTRFGTFISSNITPDIETGLGSWTNADFVNALREGISPLGKHYYPAFPYTSYALTTTEDLLHLKAYLDNLPAVNRQVEPHNIKFPFNFRFGLVIWKLLAHHARPFELDLAQTAEWNRGAYIVNGLGHCSTCHTPRNILFAESSSNRFAGAPSLEIDGETAPRIAGIDSDKVLNSLNEWAGAVNEESAMYLITQAFSNHIPLEDHDAIATYLSSLK